MAPAKNSTASDTSSTVVNWLGRVLQHDLGHDVGLRNAQCLGLLSDLLVNQRRAHEAGAHDIRGDVVFRPFLGQRAGDDRNAASLGEANGDALPMPLATSVMIATPPFRSVLRLH